MAGRYVDSNAGFCSLFIVACFRAVWVIKPVSTFYWSLLYRIFLQTVVNLLLHHTSCPLIYYLSNSTPSRWFYCIVNGVVG